MFTDVEQSNGGNRSSRSTTSDAPINLKASTPHLHFVEQLGQDCLKIGRFRGQKGQKNTWLLDCREFLANSLTARRVAREIHGLASQHFDGVSQFAGTGIGASFLIGAMLGAIEEPIQATLIRPVRKKYGMRKQLEGRVNPHQPICIVDDILNSGDTAIRVADVLRQKGFQKIYFVSIFRFDWGVGRERLTEIKIPSTELAEVYRTQQDEFVPKRRSSFWHSLWR